MSAVIVGVLKLTLGLLSKKVRAYSAQKLQNGGLADKEFRSLIVRELDDIKDGLNALARSELDNGISCLNQGVDRLNMSFNDSIDDTSQSQLPNAIQKQSEDSLTSMELSCDSMPDVGQVFALAQAVGKLKGVANKRYELAEESFKNAARDAGKAFHNSALRIEDRILACKVRIASGILEHLADPDLAACDCKRYLKELHALPSIFEDFDVYAKKGVISFINREKRVQVVESVITTNLFLLHFITTFTKEGRALNIFDWPLIECDTNAYHPLFYEVSAMENGTGISPPWCIKHDRLLHCSGISAVNGKGDIILCPVPTQSVLGKLDKETGDLQVLKEGKDEDYVKCNYLAIDEDDTVCKLTCYGRENRYDLYVCDASGNINCHQPVEFLKGKECRCFGITKDKRLAFCCEFKQNEYTLDTTVLYICDRNGQLKNSFPARISDNRIVKDMFSSSSNEIILVAVKKHGSSSSTILLYVYSVNGHLKRTVKLKLPDRSGSPNYCAVRYNYLTNNFICLVGTMMGGMWRYLQFCSETGELRKSCDLYINYLRLGFNKPKLSSHPKGNVALVCQNGALYMQ